MVEYSKVYWYNKLNMYAWHFLGIHRILTNVTKVNIIRERKKIVSSSLKMRLTLQLRKRMYSYDILRYFCFSTLFPVTVIRSPTMPVSSAATLWPERSDSLNGTTNMNLWCNQRTEKKTQHDGKWKFFSI